MTLVNRRSHSKSRPARSGHWSSRSDRRKPAVRGLRKLMHMLGLEQSYVRGSGRYDKDVQAYSATLKARLGSVGITSISGHGACAGFFRKARGLARPG